jgi:pimeloyl-ACP methyl ester carboxylesterase
MIDIAEWSYFWVGVERAELARGTVVNGTQMYVEYWIPREIKHPYSVVLVHGGGGQGLDWMGTADGRNGWAIEFLKEGYKVYVVDRPGHGRSPYHPELHGPFPRPTTFEQTSRQFTGPEKAPMPYGEQAKLHTQWPGTGVLGDPTVDQIVCGQGGAFLPDLEKTHDIWRARLSQLLDKIGPAFLMSHSMGGPSAWIAADARPNLVKGIVAVEPAGPPFGNLKWGVTASKVAYDPPVADAKDLKTVKTTPPNLDATLLQAEPAHKLRNLRNTPIALITSEASYHTPYDPGTVAFLRQAGCTVEHIELPKRRIHGNAHFMMMEKNSNEVLNTILDWMEKVAPPRNLPKPRTSETAMKVAELGHFWTGSLRKKMDYGTIVAGQMYVQYLLPAEVKHATPVVLVHGGSGQMLHYMGSGDGVAGWAHYYVQEGYKVYLVDRPGHGRAPYFPDALGPINPQPVYGAIVADFKRAAQEPNRRWMGTGDVGDPLVDQFMASQNAAPQDAAGTQGMWARAAAELLDKIGPSIVQVHSAGGPFGYLAANARPKLVKAIVNVEGGGIPLSAATPWGLTAAPVEYDPPAFDPKDLLTSTPRKLKNLAAIPIVYVTAERSQRTQGPQVVEFLNARGCKAEELRLKDRGMLGNGHFMMLETNRRQVFEAIRGWIESKVQG